MTITKTEIFLKKVICIYFILLTLTLTSALSGFQEKKVSGEEISFDWRKLRKALIAYEARPVEENARQLLQAIPGKLPARGLDGREADKALFDLVNSEPFRNSVIAGNEYLAEAAFRLHSNIGGGHVVEELEVMLGQMLANQPVLFLKLLDKYKQYYRSASEYPLSMTELRDIAPDIESDEDELRLSKLQLWLYIKRIRALQSVKDSGYKAIKDECIRVIRTHMAWSYEALESSEVEEAHSGYGGGVVVEKIFSECEDDIVCSFRKLNRTVGSYLRDKPAGKHYVAALENVIYFLDRIIGSPDCDRDIKRIKEEADRDFEEMRKTLKIVFERWRGENGIASEAMKLMEFLCGREATHEAREA